MSALGDRIRAVLKERTKGEYDTWGFVAMFMDMIDEAEKETQPYDAEALREENVRLKKIVDACVEPLNIEQELENQRKLSDYEALRECLRDVLDEITGGIDEFWMITKEGEAWMKRARELTKEG